MNAMYEFLSLVIFEFSVQILFGIVVYLAAFLKYVHSQKKIEDQYEVMVEHKDRE